MIGADHITINLAGHSISGVNAPGSEGIADDGHIGVTVKNGTVAGFFLNGVAFRHASGSAVSNMIIRKIGDGGGNTDASAGVLVSHSPRTKVSGVTVRNDHVWAFRSRRRRCPVLCAHDALARPREQGRLERGLRPLLASGSSLGEHLRRKPKENEGVEVNGGSNHAVLVGNLAVNNGSDGLVVGAVSGARIHGNVLARKHHAGLFMFDLLNSRVRGNTAYGNGTGIDLEGGPDGSSKDLMMSNRTHSNLGPGLVVANGANHNLIASNVSNANQGRAGNGGGIIVNAARHNTVRGNVTDRNLDVGIGVFQDHSGDSTGNVITNNVANANHAHGIRAVARTVDGGGNVAHHNTPLPNCVHITCR